MPCLTFFGRNKVEPATFKWSLIVLHIFWGSGVKNIPRNGKDKLCSLKDPSRRKRRNELVLNWFIHQKERNAKSNKHVFFFFTEYKVVTVAHKNKENRANKMNINEKFVVSSAESDRGEATETLYRFYYYNYLWFLPTMSVWCFIADDPEI